MRLIESGMVRTLIVKDLSRLGREYLEVGKLTELVFPSYGVRFIAINDNVDSFYGENDSPHGQGTVTARLTATLKKSCGIHRQLM